MNEYPLEPTGDALRKMGLAAVEMVVRHIDGLPESPAATWTGGRQIAGEPVPEQPSGFDELLDQIARAADVGLNTTGPGYFAYIPGGGLASAALAEFIAAALNRYIGIWAPAPALAQMEASALAWISGLFDYPPEARGIFTSGGSLANFSAVISARKDRLRENFLPGTIYVSDQGHHSVTKAALLAGFPAQNIRIIPADQDLRMDLPALTETVDADRRQGGLQPFLLVANAGTTNTGAVDPIREMRRVADESGMWLHVDAAYGGFFQMTERGRGILDGIELADSITLDPHKGMFLPYGTGCLLVREGEKLRAAHGMGGVYLKDLASKDGIDFADYSPEQSRNFRGLSVWLPLKLHGLQAFRDALNEKLDLARYCYERLKESGRFELPWEPELSTVGFRVPGDDEDQARLLGAINESQRVFLSSTVIRERSWLRVSVLSHRSHLDRMKEGVAIILEAATRLRL